MPRLPIPGQDDGVWGELLNEFLYVEHNADGTLKAGGSLLNKYTKPPAGIPEADLTSSVQAKLNATTVTPSDYVLKTTTVNGKPLSSNIALAKADIGLTNVDNTSDAAKPVSTAAQTALAAKADATALAAKADTTALTAGLATKADTTHVHTIAQVTGLQASLTSKYTLPASGIPESDLDSSVITKINNGGIINDGAIGTAKLADGAVTSLKLADNAVTATKITDATITEAKLSAAVQSKLNPTPTDLSAYFNITTDTTDALTEGTTNKFLASTDKTKLDSIATGAEVNVNADWNAVSGDAQILNKPTIPTVPVQSVNAKTGTVVLNPDDLSDSTSTNKFVTAADKTKLAAITGTNTGDQDLSGLVPKTTTVNGKALSTNITLTATDLSLTKASVGLGNVDNTSDAAKPVSTATQTALDLKAPLASPTFTGTPVAPTAVAGTSTTQVATTAFVTAAVAAVSGGGGGETTTVYLTQAEYDALGTKSSTTEYNIIG